MIILKQVMIFFYIQGDEENFNDINNYLKNNGVEL